MASTQVVRAESRKVPTYGFEMEVALPVGILWDAVKYVNSFTARIAPQIIASVDEKVDARLESGKPVVTRTMKYASFASEGAYVKNTIVQVDEKARTFKTEELEGGNLAQGFVRFLKSAAVNPVSDSKFVIDHDYGSSYQEYDRYANCGESDWEH